VADGRVYVGSNDGRLYALDVKSGAKLWEFNAGDAEIPPPALAGGRIVVGTQDGKVYCFGS
jgi:eukaryotic-like serine/threonine-protein kinase